MVSLRVLREGARGFKVAVVLTTALKVRLFVENRVGSSEQARMETPEIDRKVTGSEVVCTRKGVSSRRRVRKRADIGELVSLCV